jgi:hypothetical protein
MGWLCPQRHILSDRKKTSLIWMAVAAQPSHSFCHRRDPGARLKLQPQCLRWCRGRACSLFPVQGLWSWASSVDCHERVKDKLSSTSPQRAGACQCTAFGAPGSSHRGRTALAITHLLASHVIVGSGAAAVPGTGGGTGQKRAGRERAGRERAGRERAGRERAGQAPEHSRGRPNDHQACQAAPAPGNACGTPGCSNRTVA